MELPASFAQVVRPLEVVSLSEGASLCAGLRGIQPGFIRQRLAALVRGRPWAPAGGGLEGAAAAPQGGCEDGWVLGLAGHALAVMACLGGIACLLCALLLPRRQLAQLVRPRSPAHCSAFPPHAVVCAKVQRLHGRGMAEP